MNSMAGSTKRKAAGDGEGGASFKKKKRGNNGNWIVPKSYVSNRPKANVIEPGDMGIWVTCALHMKGKAARELETLFDEYAEKVYGIKSDEGDDGSDGENDIESAIKKELDSLKDKDKPGSDRVFTEVRIKEDCLLFMRTKAPIEPVAFSRRICQDASTLGHGGAKARYLNRLTPVSVIVKAAESSLDEGARKVLAHHFKLKPKDDRAGTSSEGPESKTDSKDDGLEAEEKPATYAIRPSIRSHNTLKSGDVIKQLADLIDRRHRVELEAPDKVILVNIYQTVCGLSVVPGDWQTLKKYNLTELYKQSANSNEKPSEDITRSSNKPATTNDDE